MTDEEYKKAKQDYENNKKRVEEEGLKLDEQFAKVSREYFDNLVSLEYGQHYIIDLTHSYDMRIYFKWNEYCSIEFRKDIAEFRLSIDKAIIILRGGDISIDHNYNYCTSPDRLMRDLHKINSSAIEDVTAYVKQKIKNF